uniref:Serine aminopeptidase S33 domain-containing protein n=1 Tax=Solanum lycopersicum TaxID=4081 RepID=A0A3Q7H7T6_SOLLC
MISLFVGNVDYRVTEESLMDRLNTNMHDACLQIDKGCRMETMLTFTTYMECRFLGIDYFRVLTVHGSADEIIPVEDALEFDEIIPNHKLHISEGANHCYTSHQAELTPVILPFIKEGLQH